MRTPVWTRSTNSFESSVICTNVPWYLNQCNRMRGMGGADRGYQHSSGGIFDCLSQVSPVSIANLGDGRHWLGVMPEGHGKVRTKKPGIEMQSLRCTENGQSLSNVTTSLINHGSKWFSSRSLALCSNRCALQYHLI